jgi:hypothetical protein
MIVAVRLQNLLRMLVRNDQAAISADFHADVEAQRKERYQQESMSIHFRSYLVLLAY